MFKGNICPASETCTEWLPVTECTKTCSGGTKKVSRTCTAIMKCNEQPCGKFTFRM